MKLFYYVFLVICFQINSVASFATTTEPAKKSIKSFYIEEDDQRFDHFDKGHFKQIMLLENFPKDSTATVLCKRLTAPGFNKQCMANFDKNGTFLLLVSARGYIPGERATFRFENKKLNIQEEYSLFPNPLESVSDNETFTLVAELLGTSYQLEIPEAKIGDKYIIKSVSGNEVIESPIEYPGMICIAPAVLGKDGGVAKVTLTCVKNNDKATIDLMWGKVIQRYLIDCQVEAHPEWKEDLYKILNES